MAYTDFLTLAETKNYLRIDADMTVDDNSIIDMIDAAFEYIEEETNHIFGLREKTYYLNSDGTKRVYDTPINSVTTPADASDYSEVIKQSYFVYMRISDFDALTLNIGYTADNFPRWVKQAALQIVKTWYYDQDKQVETSLLPNSVRQILNSKKRFIL